jgi:hypothetical protein
MIGKIARGLEGALEPVARRVYGNKYQALADAFHMASRPNAKPQMSMIADSLMPHGSRDVGTRTILSLGLPASVSIGALAAGNNMMNGDGGEYLSEEGGADRKRQTMTQIARELMPAHDPFADTRAYIEARPRTPRFDHSDDYDDAFSGGYDTPAMSRDIYAPDTGLSDEERRAQAAILLERWRAEHGRRRR